MAGPQSPLAEEANSRKQDAQHWKQRRLLDFKECYFFSHPDRQRQISSQSQPSQQTMLDAPELNTDFAFLLCDDFVTELVNTYMPEAQIWCERGRGMDVPPELWDEVKDDVKAQDRQIFDAIKASNFYSELPKAFNPDIAIGTAGLWIHRRAPHLPIEVLAVPLRELEINLGPNGEIDDRFVIRWARGVYVRTLLGEEIWAKVPDEQKRAIVDKKDDRGRTEITWGFWRKWDDLTDEVWQHVVMLGKDCIHDVEIKGEGCCPLAVPRFGATADWPWAIGPLMKGLPSLRQVDELDRQKIEAVERSVNPAITYPDDSFAAVEQGIEPGMAYPVRPGSHDAVKRIYEQPSIEPEVYQTEQMEHRLRKMFYVDYPEQRGDTPPTLGQWLDEMARAQRRIGTAGQSFWREGPLRIFLRFKYLLEKSGTIQPISRDSRMISTQPYNPAQRAAEQQEIATAVQCLQLCLQTFPEEGRMSIDGAKTINNLIEKMRTGGIIAQRDKNQIAKVLPQIAQLIQGRQHAGGAQVPGATPGANGAAAGGPGAPGPT